MPQFTTLTSRAVKLPVANIDTDQIIPARFLKVTDKEGLGKVLFCDWRYRGTVPTVEAAEQAEPEPDFVLNRPESRGAQILIAGDNFGCGSSREHAPWALAAYGFRAIISTSFADIFRSNALKNGLLPVAVDADTHAALLALPADAELTIDLVEQTLEVPGDSIRVAFSIDPFARKCLLQGVDQLGYLLSFEKAIQAYEEAREHVQAS
ncbi:MAG TPA: 3-isopropylmalate dehydratase small subunit [Aggregatilineales bacterium]|nr:3-isopropylmalate dehydratase small subunit [Chloroflexota bacterium]HOA23533.1 3-isopropylmalate dehydratase small subunit [Aggregatilineales bacterium]HPV05845.1 3-isopropylmalate dehydratase small subunit [Aggregatilineales bacterium]HQA67114.1 3-isopropylmalate dehydratase small subunit [Aggregatilineales bacterium]HQE16990.1 3-isopropylmalate dehydratase small subunit [Aggregatilineales bacterium]